MATNATVITVMNMKGGVGKTTLCAHMAGMLSMYEYEGRRRRVLAIDYDPQFNLSQMYIPANIYFDLEKKRKTSLAILKDDETIVNPFNIQVPGNHKPPPPDTLIYPIYPKKLDLVPSTLDLMYVALGQTDARTNIFEERFTKFIDACRKQYEVILIDCHPAGSILTKTSLGNSDHVIIPVLPTQFASRGVALMKSFIDSAKTGLPYHIIFNNTRLPTKEEDSIRSNPRFARHCLVQRLRYYKAFSDPIGGRGFVWHSGRPHSESARRNLNQVMTALVSRLNL